jgi:molybdopterin-guanine dinucleotide biosynthesis protein
VEKLIGMKKAVTQAKQLILDRINQTNCVDPLVYSAMSRGGKTTFLMSLRDELTASGYCPIVLSFNWSMHLYHNRGDSDKQKLIKALASRFMTTENLQLLNSSVAVNEKEILNHIERTRERKPVVLLIDELNALTREMSTEVRDFLITEFLDKKGRYLVFTTHRVMGIDSKENKSSLRSFVSVASPKSNDLR